MKRWVMAVAAAIGAAAPAGKADSIWDRRDPRYAFLFEDNRARHVGDIVTIAISESTVANDQDARTMSKTTNATATVGTGAGSGTTTPVLNATSSRQFTGSSQLTTNQIFTDQIAAVVVDILPNGNLVIEGYRSRIVGGEERVLRLTGIVRQADIANGNLIPSNNIANFRVSYIGRGPASRFNNQNYAGRIFNLIWPF